MNKAIFNRPGRGLPPADTRNHAGGLAYRMDAEPALAQMTCTGTLGSTFYVTAQGQLSEVLSLLPKCRPEFVARCAVYGRQAGFMKDMPAMIMAWMTIQAKQHPEIWAALVEQAFPLVIDNAKMLRNYVQALRSGVLGGTKTHLGSRARRLIGNWLTSASPRTLINATVGNEPSLADIVKLVRLKPRTERQAAMLGWVIDAAKSPNFDGRRNRWSPEKEAQLPDEIRALENWRRSPNANKVPNVEFRLLTGSQLPPEVWKTIALNASWQTTRMNLNTFARHGVLADPEVRQAVSNRLRNAAEISRSRVYPYQLLAAFVNLDPTIPMDVGLALQDAMEISLENVPALPGRTVVIVDTSGSMGYPVTGNRGTATTKVRIIDAAALFAVSLLRKNPSTIVVPVDTQVHPCTLNPRDSVMTNANKLAAYGGGGTALSEAFRWLTSQGIAADQVLMISDNESWADRGGYRAGTATPVAAAVDAWRRSTGSVNAKLIFNDITPSTSTPAQSGPLVLNVGGFGDEIWKIVADFVQGQHGPAYWVQRIMSASAFGADASSACAVES